MNQQKAVQYAPLENIHTETPHYVLIASTGTRKIMVVMERTNACAMQGTSNWNRQQIVLYAPKTVFAQGGTT
jgi:hypothetical protein